jgi:hypothetical protein
MSNETKQCQNCKEKFVIEPDDFAFYEKIDVPAPTFCPHCRLVRRLSWQGYRHLYKKTCAKTGESLITTHHPDSPYQIYRQDIWWGDDWDAKDYGRDYDFSRPFFEQYDELLKSVPLPALYTAYSNMVNSDYCNAASDCKNCYLAFRITGGEDSAYVNSMVDSKNSFDLSFSNHPELCYDSIRINRCYKTFFSQYCDECSEVYFCSDLVGCSNCFGCINLRNKSYCIFNEQYTKEEYQKEIKKFDWSTESGIKKIKAEVQEFMLQNPRKVLRGNSNENVSGDYIFNSKNVLDSYMVGNSHNCRYCQFVKEGPAVDCYDYSWFGDTAELMYDTCWVGLNAYNNKFSVWDYYAHDIEYCFGCHSSGNMFGCVGVRSGEYCILNKQYTKEEYEELVPKIKKHMNEMPYHDTAGNVYMYGEMLPQDICPWVYNESSAYEHFPMLKEDAKAKGLTWRDHDEREYQEATVQVPKESENVSDDFIKEILKCTTCGKNYRLIKMELDFYKRFSLPIPTNCPFCRELSRIKQLNPITTFDRTCGSCGANIETSYAPERREVVYCEGCYNKEIL